LERPRKVVSLFPHELSSPKHNVISLECTKQQRAKLALGARTSCRFRGERKLGEAGCEVRVSFGLDPALVRFLTVARIDGVDNIHPLDDLPDRTEAHFVEKRIVFEVDKDLRRARVLARGGERDRPSLVACHHGVVLDGRVAPAVHSGCAATSDHARTVHPRAQGNRLLRAKRVGAGHTIWRWWPGRLRFPTAPQSLGPRGKSGFGRRNRARPARQVAGTPMAPTRGAPAP
jgi:hypothetical protein